MVKITHLLRKDLFLTEQSNLLTYFHQVNGDHPLHDHDFIEIVIVTGGYGVHVTPHGEQVVQTGDTFILLPGAWHGYRNSELLNLSVCGVNAKLLKDELSWMENHSLLGNLLWRAPVTMDRQGIFPVQLPDEALEVCQKHLYRLQQIEDQSFEFVQPQQIAYLILFLNDLALAVANVLQATSEQVKAHLTQNDQLHPIVFKATRLMEENLAYSWTLKELSKRLGVAISYLIRLFNVSVHQSPLEYLSQQRLKRSARLLLHSEISVAAVGTEVGWSEPAYFSRRFKSHFGLSPRAYREHYRKKDVLWTAISVENAQI